MRFGARTRDVCFVHWPVDPGALSTRLPHALSVATHDGVGWVSLLAMRTRPLAGAVSLPPTFAQATLRTYVETEAGDAVHFLRVDADSRSAALAGRRVFGIPFNHVDARVELRDDEVVVRTHAPDGTPLFVGGFTVPGAVGPVESRLAWVTERSTYALADGRTGRVVHDPWEVGRSELDAVRNDLLGAEGLPDPLGDPLVRYSPGADFHLAAWPS
jgi:uncharacterized protein YqjF (DUF2071 family)